ncbi:hypothetical protein DPMN_003450 [Dreissena polymorpha]|uniref:Uncharacterized protein n=1 Tax=Dreissena polymorpha TaxID=45954 RepID=A0A9D4MKZ3_DREPO|nr:hypothetical protein DPMN_003450 [Dreissena polymorpha]
MGKLVTAIIPRETQERSRGQGLVGNKHYIRPVLDVVIISAFKGYVRMWCKDHSKTVPDDTSLNKAVTLYTPTRLLQEKIEINLLKKLYQLIN